MRFRIYARFSSAGQNPLSVGQQVDACRAWAAAHGWLEAGPPCADRARSGWSHQRRGRAGLDEVLSWAETAPGCAVLVWSLDRFSRQFGWIVQELLRLHDLGVQVADTQHGAYNLARLEGRLLLTVKASMSQEYSDQLSQRLKLALASRVDAGYWASRQLPFGLRPAGDRRPIVLEPDPQTWPIVLRVYKSAVDGLSQWRIAAALNGDGVPSPRGMRWASSTIHQVLTQPAYVGMIRWRGEIVKAKWPAYLPPNLALAAGKYVRSDKYRPRANPLSGLVYCASCGGPCRIAGGGGTLRRYQCRGRIAAVGGCRRPAYVGVEALEALCSRLAHDLDRPGVWVALAAQVAPGGILEASEAEVSALEDRRRRLAKAIAVVPDADPLIDEIRACQERLGQARLEIARAQAESPAQRANAIRDQLRANPLTMLREIIDRIEIATPPGRRPKSVVNITFSALPGITETI